LNDPDSDVRDAAKRVISGITRRSRYSR